MATILGMRSYECGALMLDAVDYSYASVQTVSYTGDRGMQLGNYTGAFARHALASTPSNASMSIWTTLTNFAANNTARFQFVLDTGEYVELKYNGSTRTLDAYVDNVLVASGSYSLPTDGWFHTQFYATISDTGSIQCKINGFMSIDYSGDTKPDVATTGVSYVQVMRSGSGYPYFDDWVWGTGGFLGDLRCIDLMPDADTAQADWTPSSGSDNYAMIDEEPYSDSDYIETSTDGHADELDLDDFDDTDVSPVAAMAWVRALEVTANGDSIEVGVDSGGTDDVTSHELSVAYTYATHVMDNDPDTSAEWTNAALDALKLRYVADIA